MFMNYILAEKWSCLLYSGDRYWLIPWQFLACRK